MGYYDPDAWDYLFSARGTCERARAALSLSSEARARAQSSSSERNKSAKTPPPPPLRTKRKKVLSCVPGARRALTSKSGLAATLEAAGLFSLGSSEALSYSFALLPRSIPLARPGAAWDAAAAAALGLGGGTRGNEWALKSGGHRGRGVEMIRGAREVAAAAAATAARASLSRLSWFASPSSRSASASSSVLQAAVSPQATVGGGRRFYLRVLFVLVSESGGGGGGGGGGGDSGLKRSTAENADGSCGSGKRGGEEDGKRRRAAAAAAAAVPRAYLYRGGIVIAESIPKKREEEKEKASEALREEGEGGGIGGGGGGNGEPVGWSGPASSPRAPASSPRGPSTPLVPPPASPTTPTVPVVNMWLHDPEHVAVWSLRDLAGALDGADRQGVAAAARSGAEDALGLALAAAAPQIAKASSSSSSSSSFPIPRHLSIELLGADFVVTPEGRVALLEINELPSTARLRKGAKVGKATAAERAFDGEKEAVIKALLRFVAGVSSSSMREKPSEVEAARAAGLKPLSEAVARGQRLLPDPSLEREAEGRRRPKGLARRLARRLFFESAAGDAAAAVLAAACPRLLVFLAELAARCGVAGPSVN